MRAVVLDFFGTLTDPSAEVSRRASFTPTARVLGVPPDAFWAAMSSSFADRIVGRYGGTRATLLAMAARCGVTPTARGGARGVSLRRRRRQPGTPGRPAAGMTPALVTNAGHPGVGHLRDDPDTFVPDLVIDDLTELPALLDDQAVPGAPKTTGTPGE